MKFAIVLALLGAALASRPTHHHHHDSTWERNIQESSFRSGREYQYVFNGQLSAGLPIPSTPQGITRLQSRVNLQMIDDRTARMQLNDVKFATSQEEQNTRAFLQPFERFESVNMEKEQEELLALPFEFTYKHGMVSEMRFNQEDQPWSENIKRAVVNMLQVNILKKDRVETSEKYDRVESSDKLNAFTTIERTLEGECEVLYSMEDGDVLESQNKEWQRWTKSVNFEKCTRRPTTQNVQTPVCRDCKPALEQEKMSSTVFNFNITGSEEQFLINSVELRSQHLFTPISKKHQLLSAFTINTLELVYAGEPKKSIEKVRAADNKKASDLVYNQEWEVAEQKWAQTGEEKYLRQMPQWAENKVEIVQKMFTLMAKQFEQNPTEIELEVAHTVTRIVKVMRMCNEKEIRQIDSFVMELIEKDNKLANQMRSVYTNTLTLAATRVTIQQFLQKLETSSTFSSAIETSLALKSLVDMRYPSVQIAEDLAKACPTMENKPLARQSCWLAYGSIINGACAQTPRIFAEDRTKTCPRDAKKRLVDQLFAQFESADNSYDQILALKTIANAGLDLSIYPLEKIILNKKHDTIIRTQAVESLRRLRHSMPTKVQQVLLPVYKNRQQPQHLRMSALHQLVSSQPEWPVLSQIGQQLRQERNQQVRAFTLSLLRSYSNNESPCEQVFSTRVEALLQAVPFRSQDIDTFESRYGKWSVYYSQIQSGYDANVATLFTNESILPTEMMASFDGVFAGEWDQYFTQVGFTQKNAEKFLKSLLSTIQEKGMEKLIVRGKRSSDSFKPTQFLNKLLEKLPFTHREHNPEEPQAMFYIRYRDMDYAFMPLDAESMPEFVKKIAEEGKIETAQIEQYLAQGSRFHSTSAAFFYESIRRVPTPLGMPVELSSKMPTVASIDGQIKVDFEPKSSTSSPSTFEGFRVHFTAQPRIASTHVLSLTVASPLAQVGTRFLHQMSWNTPVDAKVEVSWQDKFVVKTSFKTPTDERRVFMIQSRPVTFTKIVSSEVRQYPEPVERTWMLPSSQLLSQPIDRKYFKEIQVQVQGTWNRPTNQQIPTWIVDNTLEVFIVPSSSAPEQYESIFEADLYQSSKMEDNMEKHFKHSSKKSEKYLEEDEEYDEKDQESQIQKKFNWMSSQNEKVYRHRINFEVKPNIVKVNMEANCNENFHFCKTTVRAEDVDAKASFQYVPPMLPKSFEELKEQKFRNLVIVGEGNWQENTVEVKIQGEQSKDQKRWIKEVVAPRVNEHDLLLEGSRLDQYQVVINWNKWNGSNKQWSFERIWNMIQAYMRLQYPLAARIERSEESRNTNTNTIRARLTIEPRQRQTVNMTVETPIDKLVLERVEMPFALPTVQIHYEPKSKRFEEKPLYEKVIRRASKQADCIVKSTKIQTFDEVFYTNKFTPCYSVLAKDCGSGKSPRFVVLMKNTDAKADDKDDKKNVRILYRDNEIEMEVNKQNTMMSLRVNGEEKEFEKESMENVFESKHFNIIWLNKNTIKFDSDEVTVQFNGVNARIHVSALYRNQQCGLCGHYDNEKETEFYSADNKESSIPDFAKSYLYKDDECDYDQEIFNKERKHFRRLNVEDEDSYSSSDDDEEEEKKEAENYDESEEKPRKQIITVEKQHTVCFSEKPVARCENNKSVESRKEKINFLCLPSSDSWARRMMREIRREQPFTQWPEHKLRQLRDNSEMEQREWNVKVDEKCDF